MKPGGKHSLIIDKMSSLLENETFLDYLLEEAFTSVDTANTGFITLKQLQEVLFDVAEELKLTKPSSKDLETMINLFYDKPGDITLELFKIHMKQYLKKLFDIAKQSEAAIK